MQRAIEETDRRRTKQMEYNKQHGITPQTIQKAVADIMEGAYGSAGGSPRRFAKVAEDVVQYASMKPDELSRKIRELEQQMFKHAQDLEFEEAARLRDEIQHIQEQNMGLIDRVAS